MAQDYDNTNRGQIWRNEKKETDKHPDFTGTLNVDGVEFWVSAWKRKADANEKAPALSFSVKLKESNSNKPSKQNNAPENKQKEPTPAFDDDDIGF